MVKYDTMVPNALELVEQFRRQSFLELGKVLTDTEVGEYGRGYDCNRRDHATQWRDIGRETHQTGNLRALVSWPEVDGLVRHPRILPTVRALMGVHAGTLIHGTYSGAMSILEVSARHMAAHPGEPKVSQQWHRDTPHNNTHPLRLEYLQLMIYLSDVTPQTHCFAVYPESVAEIDSGQYGGWWQAPQPAAPAALRRIVPPGDFRENTKEIHGPKGTAILFSASALHAGTIRSNGGERKTVQIYFCHRKKAPELDLVIPDALLLNPEARLLYGAQSRSKPRL